MLDAQQRCKMRGDCRVTGVHWCRAQDTGVRGAVDRPPGLRWDGPGESRARTANTRGDGPRISAFDCSAGGERARARRLDRGDGRRTAKRFDDTCARTSAKDDRRSARMERATRACLLADVCRARAHPPKLSVYTLSAVTGRVRWTTSPANSKTTFERGERITVHGDLSKVGTSGSA